MDSSSNTDGEQGNIKRSNGLFVPRFSEEASPAGGCCAPSSRPGTLSAKRSKAFCALIRSRRLSQRHASAGSQRRQREGWGFFLMQSGARRCRMSKGFFRVPDQGLIRKYKRPREQNFSTVRLSRAPITIRMRDPMHLEWIRDSSTPCAACATQDRMPPAS